MLKMKKMIINQSVSRVNEYNSYNVLFVFSGFIFELNLPGILARDVLIFFEFARTSEHF